MKAKLILFSSALIALAGLAAHAGEFPDDWTWDDKPEYRTDHAALEGKPMPALHVSDWINGGITKASLKGKVVVVDLYATWCGPCMAAIPHNNELLKRYKDKGLVVIGVCTSRNGQDVFAENAAEHGIQYPAARDPELQTEKAWAVHYYPTYAVIDRKGIVRAIGLQPQHVEAVVQKLLAEPASYAPAQRLQQAIHQWLLGRGYTHVSTIPPCNPPIKKRVSVLRVYSAGNFG